MIRSIEVENFRCYRRLKLDDCARINVIVGDNGSGKTSFLEALFLTLGSSPEIAVRYRGQRGFDPTLSGSQRAIESGIWGDLFHNFSFKRPVRITLTGDGPETRALVISRGKPEESLPLSLEQEPTITGPVTFTWRDQKGIERTSVPVINPTTGVHLTPTGEDNQNFFYFAASQQVPSLENATRFSDLEAGDQRKQFIDIFAKEYGWLDNIEIEIRGGAPVLVATIKGEGRVPLPALSGGVNKTIGIMLAIAANPRSIVLVDEIENGIYFKHLAAIWRGLLTFTRSYDSQIFVSTHSAECLDALLKATGKNVSDIALWRAVREKNGSHTVRRYTGEDLLAAIRTDEEVR